MRSAFALLLVLPALGSCARKSISFRAAHPQATFVSDPQEITQSGFAENPFDVAHLFLETLPGYTGSVQVRDDSYSDEATGITRVYFRQYVGGLEVFDGDLQVNVAGNKIISYSDTLYRGLVPDTGSLDPSWELQTESHSTYCARLAEEVADSATLISSYQSQIPLDENDAHSHLLSQYHDTCDSLTLLSSMSHLYESDIRVVDPQEAALLFMVAAHPSPATSNQIVNEYSSFLNYVDTSFSTENTGVVLLHNVPGTIAPAKAKLGYVQSPSGSDTVLTLVWQLQIRLESNWYEASVSATNPTKILSVSDWAHDASVASATYHVYPFGLVNDPSAGERILDVDPYDPSASPDGWHVVADPDAPANYTTTQGNNAFAHENFKGAADWSGVYPDGGEYLSFDFDYDTTMDPPSSYINFSVTQAFYTVNSMHDLLYRYGFDEPSGNFQQYNYGKGGKQGDGAIINVQDGSSDNDAFFATPPDGEPGAMTMYKFSLSKPARDGALDAGIVIHEYCHGLSTRLTGGPADSSCLSVGEPAGLGEGYGDFVALLVRSARNNTDYYTVAPWAMNKASGTRNFPYTTSQTLNPTNYEYLSKPRYRSVHGMGEVWAEMLWTFASALVNKHGSTPTLFPPQTLSEGDEFYKLVNNRLVPRHGNSLALQLVINGMKLQPCMPSYFQARDAIILADAQLTGGENYCEIWKAFSSRGLGPNATFRPRDPWGGGSRKNDFVPPSSCSTA